MELMFLSGKPFCTCSQPAPPFGLRNAPSRDATRICPSGVIVTFLMLLTKFDRFAASCQVVPLSFDTSTLLRVASAKVSSLACTETKSTLPITGPPLQLLPLLVLTKNPAEVAAIQRFGVISISLTRAVSIDFTG